MTQAYKIIRKHARKALKDASGAVKNEADTQPQAGQSGSESENDIKSAGSLWNAAFGDNKEDRDPMKVSQSMWDVKFGAPQKTEKKTEKSANLGEAAIRSGVRKTLREFFERISANLGTDVSHDYAYPAGLDRKRLEGFYDRAVKIMNLDDDAEFEKIKKKTIVMLRAFARLNPELEMLRPHFSDEPWQIFNGIISGYNPKDILFFITHPGGFASPELRNYSKEVQQTFKKFPFRYDGGYMPSPESLRKIKKGLKRKGIEETDLRLK
jgi:hypothetical protein